MGLLLALLLALVGAGCAGEEFSEAARPVPDSADEVSADLPDPDAGFGLDVVLCRKVGSKSGRRFGVGREFQVEEKSRVQALVDFRGVSAGRTYAVHLVWIRPDGRELFRRYAEAVPRPGADGKWRTAVAWREAEDLNHADFDTLVTDSAAFTLDSRLNISADREREPGEYRFRVYLDRRLLRDEAFTVLAAATAE